MVVADRIKAHRIFVNLGSNEYAYCYYGPDRSIVRTGDNMKEAAKEVFDAHPDLEHLIVTVNEHGGWALSYSRDLMIVGSANDTALYSKEVVAYQELLRDADWQYLPTIFRPDRV